MSISLPAFAKCIKYDRVRGSERATFRLRGWPRPKLMSLYRLAGDVWRRTANDMPVTGVDERLPNT